MNLTLLLGVAVGVSAPTIKDPPKKDSTIVGEWFIESITTDGKLTRSLPGARYEFTTDGQLIDRRDEATSTPVFQYKVDPKADPPTLELGKQADDLFALSIYKVEGDTMLWCCSLDAKKRPKAFDAAAGSGQILTVLKRVKK